MIFRKLFGSKSQPAIQRIEEEPGPPLRGRGVYTSTATVVVYDLDSLKHRFDDEVDWWADPKDEIDELRKRNLLIIGLRSDGFYDVVTTETEADAQQSYSLHFPTGRIFIGPGEELTGGGRQPTGEQGGFFVSVEPGDYKVAIAREDDCLTIGLVQHESFENPNEPVILDA